MQKNTLILSIFCLFTLAGWTSNPKLHFIHHDGFIIESDSLVFYIDMIQIPDSTFPEPDALFVTHAHSDHFDMTVTVTLAKTYDVPVVSTEPVINSIVDSLPADQLISYSPGVRKRVSDTFMGVDLKVYGSTDGTPQNSYRFQFPSGFTIYHNGDMPDATFYHFANRNRYQELKNMDIAIFESWVFFDFAEVFNIITPDVLIKSHNWNNPAQIYEDFPSMIEFERGSTYIYNGSQSSTNDISAAVKKIYPNPAHEYLYIEDLTINSRVFIYNLQGQNVKNTYYSPSGIYVNDLVSGVYFIQFEDPLHTQNRTIQKIIIE